MPLPVAVPGPPPPPPPVIVLPTPPPPSDGYVVTWIAPDGSTIPLTNPDVGWHSLDSVSGALGAAPIALTTDPYARGGAKVRHIQPQPRTINWPIRISGPTHDEFQARLRFLSKYLTQTRRLGPGLLQIAQPGGGMRQIACYYSDGLEPAAGNMSGWLYGDCVLTLFCEDPYWVDPVPVEIEREFSGGDVDYQDPYPSVSSSQTLGASVAHNPGDVEAWPEYTVYGPASGFEATLSDDDGNVISSFTLDPNAPGLTHGNILLGETMTVTTNPPAVRGPDGSIYTAALNFPDADLWPLEPGDNNVTLAITGAGTGSKVVLTFNPRYETP